MKYLIVQDWTSTSGNHAGMLHMCEMLCERFPDKYEMYVKGCSKSWNFLPNTNLINRLRNKFTQIKKNNYLNKIYPKEYLELCKPMFKKLTDDDEVFLLEYLLPSVSQYELACFIKQHFPLVRLYALTHLTCTFFNNNGFKTNGIIAKWAEPIDKMLTLGSSLSNYFIESGISPFKISTGFHYVDTYYYNNDYPRASVCNRISIIVMGTLERNYEMIAQIVKNCQNIDWIICRGRNKDVDVLFKDYDSVTLYGYLEENELKQHMSRADISLNVMEDTIGSNVITTSIAMGLAIIVSNVGSIHDYCDDSNAIFCNNNTLSFVNAIKELENDKKRLANMKKASLLKAPNFHIEKIHQWFFLLKEE